MKTVIHRLLWLKWDVLTRHRRPQPYNIIISRLCRFVHDYGIKTYQRFKAFLKITLFQSSVIRLMNFGGCFEPCSTFQTSFGRTYFRIVLSTFRFIDILSFRRTRQMAMSYFRHTIHIRIIRVYRVRIVKVRKRMWRSMSIV